MKWLIPILAVLGFDCTGTSIPAPPGPADTIATDVFTVGNFNIHWSAETNDGRYLRVASSKAPDRPLFETFVDAPFIEVSKGQEEVIESRGSFHLLDTILTTCTEQVVESAQQEGNAWVMNGSFADCDVRYTLTFSAVDDDQLHFDIELDTSDPSYNRTRLLYASSTDEAFFGFGQQYSALNMKGRKLPIWIEEQGHGRGLQPLTFLLNTFAGGAGGSWYSSYTAVPFYVSSKSVGMFVENTEYLEFDMRENSSTSVLVFADGFSGRIIFGEKPLDVISSYTRYTGRMQPLPEWTQRGALVRLFGGTEAVEYRVDELKEAGVPLAGVWLEDWMGRRINFTGSRLWWNWQVDSELYDGWQDLVDDLNQQDIRVTTYFNPYLSDIEDDTAHARYLLEEAMEGDYLVRRGDGSLYQFGSGGFDASAIDFTNPSARRWMKDLMIESLDSGVSGWMADFAEAMPCHVSLFNKWIKGEQYHNQYPQDWQQLNREAVEEAGRMGDAVFWTRSGGPLTPGKTLMAWLGDQTVTWDHYDGIKTVVTGLLSSGISGYTLNHGDIGGYLSVDNPAVKLVRTPELLMRWVELGTIQPMFRTHDTNLPDTNPQIYSDKETLSHFTTMSELFVALAPYRATLMDEAAEDGLPLMRHPWFVYPEDETARELEFQIMLGTDVMFAPVLDPGVTSQRVYLPAGEWVHLWSGAVFDHGEGAWVEVDAPLGQPAYFIQSGSPVLDDIVTHFDVVGLDTNL